MKQKHPSPFKAIFLLIVFCMSTLVSFACAIGIEMGYNKNHHQEESVAAPLVQKHTDNHVHTHDSDHNHFIPSEKHSEKKSDDDCCEKEAKKFGKFDKITSKVTTYDHHPISFILFGESFYSLDFIKSTRLISVKRNLYRGHHPPISDTRIAIQSFII